jgi:hypothetical protein
MFRAVHRSSSGALTVFAASGLHTHVVTARSQVWVGHDYGRSPHAYVIQRLQIQLELLMMSGVPLETCWAFNERWNNKLCYKVASCWLFLLNYISSQMRVELITYLCVSHTYLAQCPYFPTGGRNYHSLRVLVYTNRSRYLYSVLRRITSKTWSPPTPK